MDHDQARTALAAYVRERFGYVVQMKEVTVVRRAAGRSFRAPLISTMSWGEVMVGHVDIQEDGRILECPTNDDLADALVRAHPLAQETQRPPAESVADDLFGDLVSDQLSAEFRFDMLEADEQIEGGGLPALREQARMLRMSGSERDLRAARDLLPRLLEDEEGRRYTLVEMADVEMKLGRNETGMQYLQAAANEFADRSEMRALELVGSMAVRVLGDAAFAVHPIKQLLDYTRRRVRPIEHLGQALVFAGLSPDDLARVEAIARPLTVAQGQVVLEEGSQALHAFVIRSGILSVRLQTSDRGSRLVRCAFPGHLLGETSVLGQPGSTCTATVRAEGVTMLWQLDGGLMRQLCAAMPVLRTRLEGGARATPARLFLLSA